MKFSTRARYGARALIELAKHQGQGPLPLKQIAQCQHIPLKYLEQIAMVLKSAKLIKSIRGPSGGYTLGRPPDTIHLLEIIETLEGSLGFVNCVKDPSTCDRVDSCAFYDLWKRLSVEASDILRSVTLADMVLKDSLKKNGLPPWVHEQVLSEKMD